MAVVSKNRRQLVKRVTRRLARTNGRVNSNINKPSDEISDGKRAQQKLMNANGPLLIVWVSRELDVDVGSDAMSRELKGSSLAALGVGSLLSLREPQAQARAPQWSFVHPLKNSDLLNWGKGWARWRAEPQQEGPSKDR